MVQPVLAAALAIAAAAVAQPAAAQQVANASARTQISIQTPGSMAKTADMNFGSIAQAAAAGTVVLTPDITASCTTTGGLIRTGVCRAAGFSVVGRHNWLVRIREMNSGVVTLNGPGGATMTMTALTLGVTNLG
jgi:hypothetical protein